MAFDRAHPRLVGLRVARHAIVGGGCAAVVWMIFMRHYGPADLSVFVQAGRAVDAGASPYANPSSPSVWSGHAFVYPYVVAWAFVPFGELSMAAAGALYYAASVAALWTTVRLLAGPRSGILPVALTLTAEPVVRSVQLGTLNVWLLFGLALTWRFRRRTGVVMATLAAVIVAKLFLLPMLAWLVLTRRTRVAGLTALVAGAVVLIGCAMADLTPGSYERMLSVLSVHEGPQSSSITGLLERLGADSTVATAVVLLIATLVVAVAWAESRRRNAEAYLFCGCVAASIAASPIVWSHYYTLLVLLPLTLHWRRRSLLIAWVSSWLLAAPGAAPALYALQPIHPIVGSCAAMAVLTAGARAASRSRCSGRRSER